jgi:hypothetical protein
MDALDEIRSTPPGLYDLLHLVWELYAEGGVTITTSAHEGNAVLARTVIQPDGDVIVRVSDAARGDPAIWARHLADVTARLAPLGHLPMLTERAGLLRRWGRLGATGVYHLTLASTPTLFISSVGSWVYILVASLVLSGVGHLTRRRLLRAGMDLTVVVVVWSFRRRHRARSPRPPARGA